MIFVKIGQYLKAALAPHRDPWAVAEAELEEDLRLFPDADQASRLASAKHALRSGVKASVVGAAFPQEIVEARKTVVREKMQKARNMPARKTATRDVALSALVTYRVFNEVIERPFAKLIFRRGVISPGMRVAMEILGTESKKSHESSSFKRAANS